MNFYFKISTIGLLFVFLSGCNLYKENKLNSNNDSNIFNESDNFKDQERELDARNARNAVGSIFQSSKLVSVPPIDPSKLQQCVDTYPTYIHEAPGRIVVDFFSDAQKTSRINKILESIKISNRLPINKNYSKFGWFWNPSWSTITSEQFRYGTPDHKQIAKLAEKILDENPTISQVSPLNYEKHPAALLIVLSDFVSPDEFSNLLKKYNLEPLEIEPINDLNYMFVFEVEPGKEKAWLCYFSIFKNDLVKNVFQDQTLDELGSF